MQPTLVLSLIGRYHPPAVYTPRPARPTGPSRPTCLAREQPRRLHCERRCVEGSPDCELVNGSNPGESSCFKARVGLGHQCCTSPFPTPGTLQPRYRKHSHTKTTAPLIPALAPIYQPGQRRPVAYRHWRPATRKPPPVSRNANHHSLSPTARWASLLSNLPRPRDAIQCGSLVPNWAMPAEQRPEHVGPSPQLAWPDCASPSKCKQARNASILVEASNANKPKRYSH